MRSIELGSDVVRVLSSNLGRRGPLHTMHTWTLQTLQDIINYLQEISTELRERCTATAHKGANGLSAGRRAMQNSPLTQALQ